MKNTEIHIQYKFFLTKLVFVVLKLFITKKNSRKIKIRKKELFFQKPKEFENFGFQELEDCN